MKIKKYETKDRYGNSKSFEFFEGSADMNIPGMTNMPDHPGEPKGTDTVPAWLTPGEFVINKEATDMYGPLLKNINDEGRKMQNGEPHNHPSEAMYAAAGDVVTPATQMSKDEIYRYLIDDLEFTSNAAKGIMSNFNSETAGSFSGAQAQIGGGPGRGLAQWEVGGRYDTDPTNLVKFAAQRNIDPADARTQLDFLDYEMRLNTDTLPEKLADGSNNPDYAPFRKFGDLRVRMNEAKTPGEAATLFMNEYEKPADRSEDRYTYANNYLVGTDDTPPIKELSLAPEIATAGAMAPNEFGDIDLTGAMAPNEFGNIDSAGAMAPIITQQTLNSDIQTIDRQINDTKAQLASIKKEEVATEDPSFLDRAGDFIRDAVSGYRDMREDYRKKYIDYYNADQGYFDSIYRQAGGPVPQYYAVGDEVRDYYRSGIPMPGSAPTYNYSNAPTFETMADTIKDKLEKEEAERLREAQKDRFKSYDDLSMDRLKTMQLTEKLDKLERQKAALNSERFKEADQASVTDLAEMKLREQLDASSKGTREDAFNKNYYTGVPGDVPSADEFMNIPKDTMPPKINVEPIDPTFYDAFGNTYDDAEQASKSDLINEADSKAAMQRQMQINSLGQRDPITDKPFYDMTASQAASLDDANLSLYQDMDVPEVKEPEKVTQNVSNGDVIFREDTNMLYTVDDKGILTDSYGRVADAETMQAFVDFQKGNDSEIKLSKYQPPSAASLEELNKRKAELTNKANEEIKLTGQVSEETTEVLGEINSEISIVKGQATQTGTAETRRWRDRETKRRKDAEKETKKLMLKYKDAKRNANRLGIADFPSFEDWAKRQNIDPAKIDTQNYLKKGVNIGPAANDIIDTEGLGLTDNQLANSGALTSRLDGLDDGSAENFDVNTVEQKGNAELGLGESFNLDGVVKKALENKNPKFVKTKSFLSKYFGDLFDTKELGRMAVLYLGSRAMGASHNGSLAWAGKYYLKRIENNEANHTARVKAAITSKLYTPASIELYKKSRKESDLKPIISGSTFQILGNQKELFNQKLNKRDQAIEVKMTGANGLEQKFYTFNPYNKNKPGYMQPASMDWGADDSGVQGTPGYASLLASNVKLAEDVYKDAIEADKKLFAEAGSQNRLGTGATTFANQTAEWAMNLDYDAARLGDASRLAYAAMIKDMDANPTKRPTDIRPYLNAALIRQSSNIGGNLFEPLDGKTPNTERIINLNKQFMSTGKNPVKDWESLRGRDDLSDKYKNAADLFNEDLKNNPDYINTTVTNNVKPGESLFMAWLRREMAGLGPK